MFKVLEPCSRVELGVDSVDEPWELGATWRLFDLDHDEANDRSWVRDVSCVGGLPSNGEEVAVGLDIELLEVDRRLLALANHELVAVAEGGGQEGNGSCLCGIALRAGVDEGVDALGVVGEVLGQRLQRELVAVVADELGVVVRDLLRLSAGHTLAVGPSLFGWCGEGTDGSEAEEDQRCERNHVELRVLCDRTLDSGLAGMICVICTFGGYFLKRLNAEIMSESRKLSICVALCRF